MTSATSTVRPDILDNVGPSLRTILQTEDRRALTIDWDSGCAKVMKVPRLESIDSIAGRWLYALTGAEQKMFVDCFYFLRKGVAWPVYSLSTDAVLPPARAVATEELGFDIITPHGVVLVRRAPENNRDEDASRQEYEDGMVSYGYNSDGRAPMILMRAHEHERWVASDFCAWAYAAATCSEAWYGGRQKFPDNKNLAITQVTGFTNIIEIVRSCPSDAPLGPQHSVLVSHAFPESSLFYPPDASCSAHNYRSRFHTSSRPHLLVQLSTLMLLITEKQIE